MGLFSRRQKEPSLRLYYASDVHGSDVCWRKFLNAAPHYEVTALIMGGDLTGKGLAPVVRHDGSWTIPIAGEERPVSTEEELQELEAGLRRSGLYPARMSQAELERLRADTAYRDEVFDRAIVDEVRRWMDLADERLTGGDVMAYVMPGNDDPWPIDEAIDGHDRVVACDGRVVRVGTHEMISLAWANRTPWDSPRELDEDDLYTRIRALTDQLESPRSAIFNLHVPPYDSGLDTATELDETFRPVTIGGQPHEIPVGSTAVRQAIEEVQPALALHGHIHESRGITQIGRTVCVNPGSNYATGRIDGAVIDLTEDGVRHKHLVTG